MALVNKDVSIGNNQPLHRHTRHPYRLLWERFITKAPDLFAPKSGQMTVIDITSSNGGRPADGPDQHLACPTRSSNSIQTLSTIEELDNALDRLSSESTRILVLKRLNSWSRLNITYDMFRQIYTSLKITPSFLTIVMGLGRKLSSRDEDFMSCYCSIQETKQLVDSRESGCDVLDFQIHFELAYNIRHFELHGRDLEDPWSCRQMAVYQQYNLRNASSSWLLIQPPKDLETTLKDVTTSTDEHRLSIHLRCLVAGTINWSDYLDYLSGSLRTLDEKVAIFKPFKELGLDFSSKQRIHVLRRKLHHAHAVLSNTLRTVSRISAHEKVLAAKTHMQQPIHSAFQVELQNIRANVENHKQTVQKLLCFSKDLALLYDDILKLHGQEVLHNNGHQLTLIAQGDSHETKAMAALTEKAQRDSRITRIATLVAMVYLPANLIMSFFSTQLVWYQTNDSKNENSSLKVHSDVWIIVVGTLLLTACTFVACWWWDRKEKRSSAMRPHAL
ncbi:hypothetical protein F5Y16DRAFT_63153 [Xylariaceae sp. FL0255]|nr:hypothetical protein F5Y16DRAFT_63153 [Xylariaceae sp. FL0255]